MMRAAVLHATGGPDSFSIEQRPVPAVEPGSVLLRVLACGVSAKDVVERNGTYRREMSFPIVLGAEMCGEIVEVGPGVRSVSRGDIVCTKAFASCGICGYCRTGRETTCLERRHVRGGYAEYALVAEDACVEAPADISPEMACTLGPGAGVALNAVRDTAKVALGETVLVTGASGGVGIAAVQISRAAGASVIALTRNSAKAAELIAAGASNVITIPENGVFSPRVRDLTYGLGVDVVIDTVGSAVFREAFDCLALHGRMALVGQLNGDEVSINLARIFFKRAELLGVGSVSRKQLSDAIELAVAGVVRPPIARVLPLEQIAEAHRLVEAAGAFGRIVIKP